jgi:hypothetical protein
MKSCTHFLKNYCEFQTNSLHFFSWKFALWRHWVLIYCWKTFYCKLLASLTVQCGWIPQSTYLEEGFIPNYLSLLCIGWRHPSRLLWPDWVLQFLPPLHCSSSSSQPCPSLLRRYQQRIREHSPHIWVYPSSRHLSLWYTYLVKYTPFQHACMHNLCSCIFWPQYLSSIIWGADLDRQSRATASFPN